MQKLIRSITDEDLQLYLLGELRGDKRDIVQSIDEVVELEKLSENEKDLKTQLLKIREIDELLVHSSEVSFPMPQELETKLALAFEGRQQKEIEKSWSLSNLVRKLKNSFELRSLGSGAAVASILTVIFLQANPRLLINMAEWDQLKISNSIVTEELAQLGKEHQNALEKISALQTLQTQYRSALPNALAAQNNAAFASASTNTKNDKPMPKSWAVLEKIAAQILVQRGSEWTLLNDKDEVAIGQRFLIRILPLDDSRIDILYYSNDGSVTQLVSDLNVTTGISVSFPDLMKTPTYARFDEPSGIDKISIFLNGEEKLSYSFLVK